MPSFLSAKIAPSDRKVLVFFGLGMLVLLGILFAFGSGASSGGMGIPSSYSYGARGARAAFLLLRESGYHVERWEKSPLELPSPGRGTVLILAEPFLPPRAEDVQALSRFVRTGGRILAVGELAADAFLPEGSAEMGEAWPGETKTYAARLPSPITLGAAEIEMEPAGSWASPNPAHLGLYGDGHERVAVDYHLGEGRVVWWAGAWPLTNMGISSKQNLELFLNSVGPPGASQHVYWDEYFHGERGSLWAYLRTTPVPWAGLQLALFGMALIATFGRRWGPVRSRRTEPRLSTLEFVDTLGGLYEQARAAAPAVGVALGRFRFLLARRLGLPAGTPGAELGRAARTRLGAAAEGLSGLLVEADTAVANPRLRDAQALRLVRSLHDYAEALRLVPRAPGSEVSSPSPEREGH